LVLSAWLSTNLRLTSTGNQHHADIIGPVTPQAFQEEQAMASATAAPKAPVMVAQPAAGTLVVTAIALTIAVVHLLTNGRYGFHRDELQTLSDALHMDWGFVVYPPFTPMVERVGLAIFGVSLVGLRLFSVIAQAAAVIVTGLMARELGGKLWAQAAAALGTAVAPLSLFEGTEFQYTTFDYLWWVLIAYFVIRLLKSENPRWCLAIGATVGLGLMTKYTMAFYLAGILAGFLLTPARRYLASRWFWMGTGLAFLIFLPNLIWQFRHDFISLHFLQHIHVRDVGQGRAEGFWRSQFFLCANRYAMPLWIAGLFSFLLNRRFRMLAWMYVVPVMIMWLAKGRGYYTGAAYPMLMAMGAPIIEGWLNPLPRLWRGAIKLVYLAALVCFAGNRALFRERSAARPRVKRKRRPARGDRMERAGQDRRRYSRLSARRPTRQSWNIGWKLRRAGSHRDPGPGLPSSAAYQRNQLGMVSELPQCSAGRADRDRIFP
jgi:4-amino-4-deoxy-L-arabinose transferase-like glycosyltransferase